MEEKIQCLICGSFMKRITRTHLKKHDITTDEYKSRFPEASIVSAVLAHKLGKASREMTSVRKEQVSVWAKIVNKGIPKSDDHKKKLSEARLGKSWGHHTDEHKRKVTNLNRMMWEKRKAEGWKIVWSEESKKKRSETMKRKFATGELVSASKGKPNNKGMKLNLSQEQRKNRSDKRVKNETKSTNTSIEKMFKAFLDEQNHLSYQHQFPITTENGSWLCDFFIPSMNLIVETDGEYHHSRKNQINRDILKTKIVIDRGYRIARISDKDWRPEIIFESDETLREHNANILLRRSEKFPDLISQIRCYRKPVP